MSYSKWGILVVAMYCLTRYHAHTSIATQLYTEAVGSASSPHKHSHSVIYHIRIVEAGSVSMESEKGQNDVESTTTDTKPHHFTP
jgi:hypothetical protein